MTDLPKLTKSQQWLLFDLSFKPELVDHAYQPALDLIALRLATKRMVPWNLIRVTIIKLGRAHPGAATPTA